jgi:ABC-type uncharacterized transport system fused permease/ATPase subunit
MFKKMNIILISAGHREELQKYHDIKVTLDGHGDWKYTLLNSN